MVRILNEQARKQYEHEGYYFPIDVLSADQIAAARGKLEAFEASQGHPIAGAERGKSHLIFTWIDELIRHPRILDAVEDLIGSDILCWTTVWWIKEAASDAYATDYPAMVGPHMTNTDSTPFMNIVPSISLRENERGMHVGAGWDPHWHQPTDLYSTFTDDDFRLGLNAAQTTLAAIAQLVDAMITGRQVGAPGADIRGARLQPCLAGL